MKKILVISLAGIGDTLLATPLLEELRAQYPDARLEAFVLWAGARDILEGNPHLDAFHQLNLLTASKPAITRFLLGLRRQRYDLTINTHPQSRTAYRVIARIIGAPVRLSHLYECSGWLDRQLMTHSLPQDYTRHTVDNNLALLSLLGLSPKRANLDASMYLTDALHAQAGQTLETLGWAGRPVIGFHVGSGGTKNLALKRWPLAHYQALIQRLVQEHPAACCLLFGGPQEQADHETILQALASPRVRVAPTKNLREAAALMRRCHAFVSVDTALMHLAAALKVRNQVVIEAPTLNVTNFPYRQSCRVVPNPAVNGRNLDYYRYDGRGIQGSDEELLRCMASVTVDAVFQAVAETLR